VQSGSAYRIVSFTRSEQKTVTKVCAATRWKRFATEWFNDQLVLCSGDNEHTWCCVQVCQLSAQKSIQDEMLSRLNAVRDRLDENKAQCIEASCCGCCGFCLFLNDVILFFSSLTLLVGRQEGHLVSWRCLADLV